ncbi:MAG: hypothetical protein AUJ97_00100 [Bacteroidetes bacterium CG2_30_32_10]|nr:MAG: hypothetical protein AUJ97_00100 [Bacteroidetes bacterium CG2_30_32_10]
MKKMISANDFQTLPYSEKEKLILDIGEELATRLDNIYIIKLFILFDFFVEVTYLTEDNTIKQIDAITDSYLTESYLTNIDISDLFTKK